MSLGTIRTAVYNRLNGSSVLQTEVGTRSGALRLFQGDAPDEPQSTDFPRLRFQVTPVEENGVVLTGTLLLESFVWYEGASGGSAKRNTIEAEIRSLFDENWWLEGGRRYAAWIVDSQDRPRDERGPLHDFFEIEVQESS